MTTGTELAMKYGPSRGEALAEKVADALRRYRLPDLSPTEWGAVLYALRNVPSEAVQRTYEDGIREAMTLCAEYGFDNLATILRAKLGMSKLERKEHVASRSRSEQPSLSAPDGKCQACGGAGCPKCDARHLLTNSKEKR